MTLWCFDLALLWVSGDWAGNSYATGFNGLKSPGRLLIASSSQNPNEFTFIHNTYLRIYTINEHRARSRLMRTPEENGNLTVEGKQVKPGEVNVPSDTTSV